ncbi:DDB1- and CUL4-associated factor 8 [Linum perenne]
MGMRIRCQASVDTAVVDVWQREVGQLSGRRFCHRLAASKDLVLRLELCRKLEKHLGCVNTVSFNACGDILVSGSDDRQVVLWDWENGSVKLAFHSGHQGNVFQAKIMPFSGDHSIVTCAADGQVRHAQIRENGEVETEMLAKHQGRAHKLAVEPGSPHIFYTCGEDGLVQHFDLRTRSATELFNCPPLEDRAAYMPVVHLNAIAIDPRNPNLFAVAGSDEYTRLYDIRKYKWDTSTDFSDPADYFCPPHLIGDDQVGITGLAFSDQSELLVTYNDEFIYLFARDMGLGPNIEKPSADCYEKINPQVYKGHRNCETVKGVNFFGPRCEYVVSGSDCGRIFIWKKKGGELIHVLEADKHVVNCIEPHPHSTVLASSGIERDIKIFTPKAIEKATLPTNIGQVRVRSHIRWFAFDDDITDTDDEEEEDDDDEDDDGDYFCDHLDAEDEEHESEDNEDDEDSDEDDEDMDDDDVDNINDDHNCEDDDNKDDDDFVDKYDDDATNSDSHFLCSAETQR